MEEDFSWEDDLMTKSYKRQESHLAKYNFCFKNQYQIISILSIASENVHNNIRNYKVIEQNMN